MEPAACLIRNLMRPLEPIPTGLHPRLPRLEGIRCLAVDIYGTLLISERQCPREAMAKLTTAHQLPQKNPSALDEIISRHHAKARSQGIDFPEVDIRLTWQELYQGCDSEKLALHYELLSHKVWPMPGLELPDNLLIAIISNAQFYTPLILDTIRPLPVQPEFALYSFQYLQAKPGPFLFEMLKGNLALQNISPSEVLYLGNDHLRDILPAKQAGFRTALFAGDERSLVTSPGDSPPDAVITHLSQLSSLFGVSSLIK